MIAAARRASYDVLRAVASGTRDLAHALADVRGSLDDERDRGLVMTIATGTLRWRNRLDWLIARVARRPVTRLDPEVLDILRLALYQLLFLTRVPAAAVVNDAVQMARVVGKSSASGLVNAVLRTLSRTRHHLDLPQSPGDDAETSREQWLDALSITGSHPRWLVARWLDRLGPGAAAAWVAFNNEEPTLTVRANRLRTTRERLAGELAAAGIPTRPLRFAPDGLAVESGSPLRTPLAEGGTFVVQDESSQVVPLMAGTAPRRRSLDACASPGGKTLVLAAGPAASGLLVAADRRPSRIALLRERLDLHGASRVPIVALDLERGAPFSDVFDLVLLDAPCTGLGTIRRDVDIRWRRTEDDVRSAAAAQSRMLREAARAVAPGGRLVYATCSSEPEENQQVAAAFAAEHSGFTPVPRDALVRDGVPEALLDPAGALVTRPDLHGLEAFFAIAFDRAA